MQLSQHVASILHRQVNTEVDFFFYCTQTFFTLVLQINVKIRIMLSDEMEAAFAWLRRDSGHLPHFLLPILPTELKIMFLEQAHKLALFQKCLFMIWTHF